MKIIIVTICCFAINLAATAQRGKVVKAKTVAPQVTQIDQAVKPINVAIFGLPKQDKNLAQVTGTIKNETSYTFDFANISQGKYGIDVCSVYYKEEGKPGGLLNNRFCRNSAININKSNIVFEKINEKEYKYTIYNMPLNQKFIINLYYSPSIIAADDVYTTLDVNNLTNVALTGAFTEAQTNDTNFNLSPNYIATTAAQVLMQNITITNPIIVK
jgi:hypothetical protein